MREHHKNRRASKEKISWSKAKANRQQTTWSQDIVKTPNFTGVKLFDNISLEEIRNYIDWTPFFQTWDLHGRYPNILEDKIVGKEAKKLLADANKMLDKIIAEKWLGNKAVVGIWRANAAGEDIEVYSDESRIKIAEKHCLEYILICYGDTLVNLDVNKLIKFHLINKADLSLSVYNQKISFGVVNIDESNNIKSFNISKR